MKDENGNSIVEKNDNKDLEKLKAELDAVRKQNELITLEKQELEKKHSNTIEANKRLAGKKKEISIEPKTIEKDGALQSEIETLKNSVELIKKEKQEFELSTKKEKIKNKLSKSGFNNPELLLSQIDNIEEFDIEKDFGNAEKLFKEKYSTLLSDEINIGTNNTGINFPEGNSHSKKINELETKLNKNETLSEEDLGMAMFNGK